MDTDFLILLFGRLFQGILAFVAIKLSTTLLDKSEVGNIYLVASITGYFSSVFINPTGMFLNRKLHTWAKAKVLRRVFQLLNGYYVFIGLLSFPLIWVAHKIVGVGSTFTYGSLVLLIFLNIYIGSWFQTILPVINMLERRRAFVFFTVFSSVFGIGTGIGLVHFIHPDAFYWLLGAVLGQTVSLILAYLYFRQRFLVESNPAQKIDATPKELFRFCLPIAFTTFFMWGQTQSYRLIVESKVGLDYLAILGVGLGVSSSISSVVESLSIQYLYPEYYKRISDTDSKGRAEAWNILFEKSISVLIPVFFSICTCAPFILHLLVDKKFHDLFYLLIMGAIVDFFRIATNIIYIVSHSEMNTKTTIPVYFSAAIIVVAGVSLSASSSHADFIPGVLMLAGLVTTVMMYYKMKKVLPIQINFNVLLRQAFYSLPLLICILFWGDSNIWKDLAVCCAAGGYTLYVLSKLTFKKSDFARTVST